MTELIVRGVNLGFSYYHFRFADKLKFHCVELSWNACCAAANLCRCQQLMRKHLVNAILMFDNAHTKIAKSKSHPINDNEIRPLFNHVMLFVLFIKSLVCN